MMAPKHPLLLLIILINCLQSQSQVISWAKSIGGSGQDQVGLIFTDKWNNNYIIGSHTDPMDVDPGPDEYDLGMIGSGTVFIAKYSPDFEFVWAYNLYNPYALMPTTFSYIGQDSVGNFYMRGEFTYDVNPDFIEYSTPLYGGYEDMWFAKYDPSFNVIWAKAITAEGEQFVQCAGVDKSGNIYLGGSFADTVDFDPGPDSFYLTTDESISTRFLAKYNSDGEFILANKMGGDYTGTLDKLCFDYHDNLYFCSSGNSNDPIDLDLGPGELVDTLCHYLVKYDVESNYLWHIEISDCYAYWDFTVDSTGNIYFFGPAWSDLDYDPGPDTLYFPLPDEPDYRMVKFNTSGNFEWAKIISGTGSLGCDKIVVDDESNIYLAGHYDNVIDFDPGPGIFEPFASGDNGFISKYTSSGDLISFLNIGGSYSTDEYVESMLKPTADEMICLGYFDSENSDFDPTDSMYTLTYYGDDDIFFAKYLQGECASTFLTIDSLLSMSCSNETGYIKATLHGIAPYSYIWNTVPPIYTDEIYITAPGVYELNAVDSAGCEFNRFTIISSPLSFDSTDLNLIFTTTTFSPGNNSHVYITGMNDGCLSTDGTLSVIIDQQLDFISAEPEPDFISDSLYTWNFTGLVYNGETISIDINTYTPTDMGFGDSVVFNVSISPIEDDINISNNSKVFSRDILAAYDPNIKVVYPEGIGSENIVAANLSMMYTIHFQNTGNYPASNIYILDTVDNNLNLSSLRVLYSSHPMNTEVLNDSVLKFIFDDINLPDSLSDEPASHAYLTYTLDQKNDLLNGTVIQNNAAIFFDYNPPVMTGEIFNTVGEIVESVNDQILEIFAIYPNPVHDKLIVQTPMKDNYQLTIIDCLGRLVSTYYLSDNSMVDVSEVPAGIYFVNIQTSKDIYSYKLIKN